MTEIARAIQAAQMAYQQTTKRTTIQSKWESNIEKKIKGLKTLIKFIKRVLKVEELDKTEKSEL